MRALLDWAAANRASNGVAAAVAALETAAAGDLDRLRTEVEAWFDAAMDRVSGAYKRWTQWTGVVLGLVVAVALNIDTIGIAGSLWTQPSTRAALAGVAERYARGQIDGATYRSLLADLGEAGVALGWPGGFAFTWTMPLGWLLTAFALSVGAAFWFDALGRLVNLRAAGPKPPSRGEPQP